MACNLSASSSALVVALTTALLAIFAGGADSAVARWPAGIAAAACPNYPFCDPFVDPRTGINIAAPAPAAAPSPVFYSLSMYAPAIASAALRGPADSVPAGIDAAECPNFPFCHDGHGNGNFAAGTSRSAFVGTPLSAKYPAGIHPSVCPNYPYCF